MADVLDIAAENEQRFLEDNIRANRASATQLKPTGECRYCNVKISIEAQNKRFCDGYCRDGYEYLKKRGIAG